MVCRYRKSVAYILCAVSMSKIPGKDAMGVSDEKKAGVHFILFLSGVWSVCFRTNRAGISF